MDEARKAGWSERAGSDARALSAVPDLTTGIDLEQKLVISTTPVAHSIWPARESPGNIGNREIYRLLRESFRAGWTARGIADLSAIWDLEACRE
jgi:hypothetical protein